MQLAASVTVLVASAVGTVAAVAAAVVALAARLARQALHGNFGRPFTQCFCGAWEFLDDSSGPLK